MDSDDKTYGFGPREGYLCDLLREILIRFADSQDIALPELLGYLDILKMHMITDMAMPLPVDDDDDDDHMENDWPIEFVP